MSARTYNLFKPKKYGNVEVQVSSSDNETIKVYLHGNNVLSYNPRTKELIVNHCGRITPTTVTAINTGLNQLNLPYGVFRKQGIMYISGFKHVFNKDQMLSGKSRVTSDGLIVV